MRRFLLVLMCVLLLCASLTGCSDKTVVYRFDLESKVTNLDPQYSTEKDASIILLNVMEGLTAVRPDGSVELAAAERYSLSADQLMYTFSLHKDRFWSNGQPVTAHDFVFAFQRLFNHEAPSPYAGDFSMIYNGVLALEGSASASLIGVSAVDDYTLEIKLEQPSAGFFRLLATSPALPCNEAFFKSTSGQYGLSSDLLLTNGPLGIDSWGSKNIILIPSETYPKDGLVLPDQAVLYFDATDRESRLLDGKTNVGYLSYENLSTLENARYQEDCSTVWLLFFNQNNAVFSNENIRGAFAKAADREGLQSDLSANLQAASVILPPAVQVGGLVYRDAVGSSSPVAYDPASAARQLKDGLGEVNLEKMPKLVIYVPEEGGHTRHLEGMQKSWMSDLGVFANLSTEPMSQLRNRYMSGDWQMVLMPITSTRADAESVFMSFSNTSTSNYCGHNSSEFEEALAESQLLAGEQAVAAVQLAENRLLTEYAAIPLYFETTYFVWGEKSEGIEYIPFGGGPRFFTRQAAQV